MIKLNCKESVGVFKKKKEEEVDQITERQGKDYPIGPVED